MGNEEPADENEGRRFEALREAVESESYLEDGDVAATDEVDDDPAPSESAETATDAAISNDGQPEGGTQTPAESPAVPGDSAADPSEHARESPREPAPEDSDRTDPGPAPAEPAPAEDGADGVADASVSSASDPGGPSSPSGGAERSAASTDSPDDVDSSGASPAPAQPEWPSAEDTGPGEDELAESLLSVSSILVLGSGEETDSGRVCSHLLGGGDGDQNVVVVAFADTPADRLATLDANVAESNDVVVIDVGDMANDAGATALDADRWPNVTVRPMTNPSDASRLGMVIDDVVSAWEDEPYQTRVCFHSLSGLLEYMNDETAFRFIHTLLRRFAAVEAVAHFHMDTEAQSIETLRTLQVLFEEVVSVSEDGELSAVEM